MNFYRGKNGLATLTNNYKMAAAFTNMRVFLKL